MPGTKLPLLRADGTGCGSTGLPTAPLDVPEPAGPDGETGNRLGLNVTMQCPLRCDFCCYSCHPKRTERMPVELAIDLVRQAARLGVFTDVAFTGGEPFLWFDELLAVSEVLLEVGMPFYAVSSGHWGADGDEAVNIVKTLAGRGMRKLSLSTDPSHARFVPPTSVVNAALAAAGEGLKVHVTGAFVDPSASLEAFVPALVGIPNVTLTTQRVAPAGRGRKQRAAWERRCEGTVEQVRCYRPVYHDVVFFWDGDAYPCCSVFNREIDGIRLGNAYEDSLKTLWERAEGSMLLRVMKRAGFQHLYDVLVDLDPTLARRLPPLDPSVGACRLCRDIFSDVELARDIRNTLLAYERRSVDALLKSLEGDFGAATAVAIVRSALAWTGDRSDERQQPA